MFINAVIKHLGLKIARIKKEEKFVDDDVFMGIYEKCRPYTMTSVERMYALYTAVGYLVKKRITGDIVECGVWRGGSSMAIALTLLHFKDTERQIFLYDTFEGMSEPTEIDKTFRGEDAEDLMDKNAENKETSVWCLAEIEDVQRNMGLTGYPQKNIHYVKGKVEETIPSQMPGDKIALLRLDTDWYESTAHELKYLYPPLENAGVLIIDDYGHWEGCRKAVDEYFEARPILLNRIDYTGRIAIKC